MQAARGTPLNPSDQPAPATPESRPHLRHKLLFASVALAAYVVDVSSKVWAARALEGRSDQRVLGDFLMLSLTRNPGAAFSTGTRYTYLFTGLAMVAVVVVLYLSRRVGTRSWAIALGLLLAGVSGNLTDRLFRDPGAFRGHVVDFLRLPHWPIFNVADICIDVAAALIIWLTLRGIALDGTRHDDRSGDAA
jgi:signal peptidase II